MTANIIVHDRREEKSLYMPDKYDFVIEAYNNDDMVAFQVGQETGKNEYLRAHQSLVALNCTQIDVYIYDFAENTPED